MDDYTEFTPDRNTGGFVGYEKNSEGKSVQVELVPNRTYGGYTVYKNEVRTDTGNRKQGIGCFLSIVFWFLSPFIIIGPIVFIVCLINIIKTRASLASYILLIPSALGTAATCVVVYNLIIGNGLIGIYSLDIFGLD